MTETRFDFNGMINNTRGKTLSQYMETFENTPEHTLIILKRIVDSNQNYLFEWCKEGSIQNLFNAFLKIEHDEKSWKALLEFTITVIEATDKKFVGNIRSLDYYVLCNHPIQLFFEQDSDFFALRWDWSELFCTVIGQNHSKSLENDEKMIAIYLYCCCINFDMFDLKHAKMILSHLVWSSEKEQTSWYNSSTMICILTMLSPKVAQFILETHMNDLKRLTTIKFGILRICMIYNLKISDEMIDYCFNQFVETQSLGESQNSALIYFLWEVSIRQDWSQKSKCMKMICDWRNNTIFSIPDHNCDLKTISAHVCAIGLQGEVHIKLLESLFENSKKIVARSSNLWKKWIGLEYLKNVCKTMIFHEISIDDSIYSFLLRLNDMLDIKYSILHKWIGYVEALVSSANDSRSNDFTILCRLYPGEEIIAHKLMSSDFVLNPCVEREIQGDLKMQICHRFDTPILRDSEYLHEFICCPDYALKNDHNQKIIPSKLIRYIEDSFLPLHDNWILNVLPSSIDYEPFDTYKWRVAHLTRQCSAIISMNFKSSTLEDKIAATFKFLSIRRARLWEQNEIQSFMHKTLVSVREKSEVLDRCLQHDNNLKNSVTSIDVYNKESGYNDLFTEWMRVLSSSRVEFLSDFLPQLDQKHIELKHSE